MRFTSPDLNPGGSNASSQGLTFHYKYTSSDFRAMRGPSSWILQVSSNDNNAIFTDSYDDKCWGVSDNIYFWIYFGSFVEKALICSAA